LRLRRGNGSLSRPCRGTLPRLAGEGKAGGGAHGRVRDSLHGGEIKRPEKLAITGLEWKKSVINCGFQEGRPCSLNRRSAVQRSQIRGAKRRTAWTPWTALRLPELPDIGTHVGRVCPTCGRRNSGLLLFHAE
jgi:hypothetical protein